MAVADDIKAFIIHTPHLDRSEPLRRQLTALGVQFEMIASLSFWQNKTELETIHRGRDFYLATIGRNLSLAEVGGSYGHQLAYQRMIASKIKWGIVFEDDARLAREDLDLDKYRTYRKAVHINLAQFTRTIPSLINLDMELVRLLMPSTWAHAYLINLKTAKKYNKNYSKYGITSYPDWPYPQPSKIQFYISRHTFFTQEEPGDTPTMTDERLKIAMQNTEYSLTMPISSKRLLKRILTLGNFGFSLRHIIYHEIVLRYKVRITRAAKKIHRLISPTNR